MSRSDQLQRQLHTVLELEADHLQRFGPEPEAGGTVLLYHGDDPSQPSLAAIYAKFQSWCLLSPPMDGTVFGHLPDVTDWFSLCQAMQELLDDRRVLVLVNYPGDPVYGKGHRRAREQR